MREQQMRTENERVGNFINITVNQLSARTVLVSINYISNIRKEGLKETLDYVCDYITNSGNGKFERGYITYDDDVARAAIGIHVCEIPDSNVLKDILKMTKTALLANII